MFTCRVIKLSPLNPIGVKGGPQLFKITEIALYQRSQKAANKVGLPYFHDQKGGHIFESIINKYWLFYIFKARRKLK